MSGLGHIAIVRRPIHSRSGSGIVRSGSPRPTRLRHSPDSSRRQSSSGGRTQRFCISSKTWFWRHPQYVFCSVSFQRATVPGPLGTIRIGNSAPRYPPDKYWQRHSSYNRCCKNKRDALQSHSTPALNWEYANNLYWPPGFSGFSFSVPSVEASSPHLWPVRVKAAIGL